MRLDDGPVDAGGQTEVVRIDDEPTQAASLAGLRMHRGRVAGSAELAARHCIVEATQ
jgi:hypothetical protein